MTRFALSPHSQPSLSEARAAVVAVVAVVAAVSQMQLPPLNCELEPMTGYRQMFAVKWNLMLKRHQ